MKRSTTEASHERCHEASHASIVFSCVTQHALKRQALRRGSILDQPLPWTTTADDLTIRNGYSPIAKHAARRADPDAVATMIPGGRVHPGRTLPRRMEFHV